MVARIGIIDYGLGNLGSLVNVLKDLNCAVVVSSDPSELKGISHLILGGVGSFDTGRKNLMRLKLDDFILEHTYNLENKLLGICLGFQLLGESSMEGEESGLGILPIRFEKFSGVNTKVPHIGWNYSMISDSASLGKSGSYYFVHSYFAKLSEYSLNSVSGYSYYNQTFVSYAETNNICGCQFHPEKSGKLGLDLLEKFIKW